LQKERKGCGKLFADGRQTAAKIALPLLSLLILPPHFGLGEPAEHPGVEGFRIKPFDFRIGLHELRPLQEVEPFLEEQGDNDSAPQLRVHGFVFQEPRQGRIDPIPQKLPGGIGTEDGFRTKNEKNFSLAEPAGFAEKKKRKQDSGFRLQDAGS
jgi:hypothetical protein